MRNESGLTTGCALDATLEPAPVPDRHTRRLAIIRNAEEVTETS
jgi:hypothetical protein